MNVANPLLALAVATAASPEKFNVALPKTLEGYQFYYGEVRFDPPLYQENDPAAFITLGPLAFAVAMTERGWPITVESDYLPRSLLVP